MHVDGARMREELAARVAEQAAVAELGRLALSEMAVDDLLQRAAVVIADVLGVEFAGVLELDRAAGRLRPRAAVGWPTPAVQTSFPVSRDSHAGFTLSADGPVVVSDFCDEVRFSDTGLLLQAGIRSGVSVAIPGPDGPVGVVGAHAVRARRFGEHHLAFLRSVAHVLAGAVQRRLVEERLRHQALHDELTGLPNRTLLLDRLTHALCALERAPGAVGVLFLDLDGFKLVNDTYGHAVGDTVLRALAERLRAAVRPSDTVARFGGDELVVLCTGLADAEEATTVARRVGDALAASFPADGVEHELSAGIGVAVATDPSADPHALIRDADAALFRAKERGRGQIQMHDEAIRRDLVERVELEADLRVAVRERRLTLHYQPIVCLEDGDVIGVEALARWQHPVRGSVGPDRFIPLAEESGLIREAGVQLLETACAVAARWPAGRLAVNVSPRQLADRGLVEQVAAVLRRTGLPPARLSLELTETALFDESAVDTLVALQRLGVGLALDDFGTGYSSLTHLRRLPIHAVKVDRTFVRSVDRDGSDGAIVGGLVALADRLGLDVVAEGIETTAQADALRRLGCRFGQGYLFGRPAPVDALGPLA